LLPERKIGCFDKDKKRKEGRGLMLRRESLVRLVELATV